MSATVTIDREMGRGCVSYDGEEAWGDYYESMGVVLVDDTDCAGGLAAYNLDGNHVPNPFGFELAGDTHTPEDGPFLIWCEGSYYEGTCNVPEDNWLRDDGRFEPLEFDTFGEAQDHIDSLSDGDTYLSYGQYASDTLTIWRRI